MFKNTQIITVINLETSKRVAYYAFGANNYREIVSLNAFFHSTKQRNRYNNYLFYCKHKEQFDSDEQITKETSQKFGLVYYEPNIIWLENIWEFYRVIGWDYKKKKYTKSLDFG